MRYGYKFDGLDTVHNCDFMDDAKFKCAYERGRKTLDNFKINMDYQWYWRVYIGLWVAKQSYLLDGDFVECGVASGFMSSAICNYLDWNKSVKKFYLLDTFEGIDKSQLSKEEINIHGSSPHIYDKINYQNIINNFSEWKNILLIKGIIPHTLKQIDADKISFLHIDLNCAEPERHAFMELYPKLVNGGYILLDDYGFNGYHIQKLMWDKLSEQFNINILSLPTGQGLIIKK